MSEVCLRDSYDRLREWVGESSMLELVDELGIDASQLENLVALLIDAAYKAVDGRYAAAAACINMFLVGHEVGRSRAFGELLGEDS